MMSNQRNFITPYEQIDFFTPPFKEDDYVRPVKPPPQIDLLKPIDNEVAYLWVNLADLSQVGKIPGYGDPLTFLLQGEERLPGVWYDIKRIDETYVLVETTKGRAKDLVGALEEIGRSKMKRKIRTSITDRQPTPGGKWTFNPEFGPCL